MCSTEYFPGNSVLQPAKAEKQFQHNSGEKQIRRYFVISKAMSSYKALRKGNNFAVFLCMPLFLYLSHSSCF